jgi:phosphatidylglycerophosphate synthase
LKVVVHLTSRAALRRLCGLSLVERHLRVLDRLARCSEILLVASEDVAAEDLPAPRARARPRLACARAHAADVEAALTDPSLVLYVDAATVIDARILARLLEQAAPTAAIEDRPAGQLTRFPGARPLEVVGAAALHPTRVARLCEGGLRADLGAGCAPLGLSTIEAYVRSMRRTVDVYWFPAPAGEPATEAARCVILDASQNGVLDWPAWYLHRPIELFVARRLCEWQVSPNQITLWGALVGVAAVPAFASGHLGLALALALALGVLDGLDGKQARIKVETSRVGELEHYLDYMVETGWWAALAWYLGRSGLMSDAALWFAALWASDLLMNWGSRFFRVRKGMSLDDFSPIDRVLRLFGGRRNTYVWILFPCVLFGGGVARAYVAVVILAMLTALTRWLRVGMVLWPERHQKVVR